MMHSSLNGNPRTTNIPCCGPTNAGDETDTITFYNELPSHVRCIPKHNVQVIGEDINAKIGKEESNKFYFVKEKWGISNGRLTRKSTNIIYY